MDGLLQILMSRLGRRVLGNSGTNSSGSSSSSSSNRSSGDGGGGGCELVEYKRDIIGQFVDHDRACRVALPRQVLHPVDLNESNATSMDAEEGNEDDEGGKEGVLPSPLPNILPTLPRLVTVSQILQLCVARRINGDAYHCSGHSNSSSSLSSSSSSTSSSLPSSSSSYSTLATAVADHGTDTVLTEVDLLTLLTSIEDGVGEEGGDAASSAPRPVALVCWFEEAGAGRERVIRDRTGAIRVVAPDAEQGHFHGHTMSVLPFRRDTPADFTPHIWLLPSFRLVLRPAISSRGGGAAAGQIAGAGGGAVQPLQPWMGLEGRLLTVRLHSSSCPLRTMLSASFVPRGLGKTSRQTIWSEATHCPRL